LIGVGIVAEARVPALRAAGLDVAGVSTRPGSRRLRDFATRHGIPSVVDDWRAMLDDGEGWNALVISTWPDGTPDVLAAAMDLGVPILVEKPVAWNSGRLLELCAKPHDQVIVGYNRRFYRSVQAARSEALNGPPLIAQLALPADVVVPEAYDPSGRYLLHFFESVSALGLDLTRFVLGDLHVTAVSRLTSPAGNVAALAALLGTDRGDVLQLTGNWGTAANFALSLCRPGRRFELLPFEVASVYEGMEVQPPSPDYPVRRYVPKPVAMIALDGVDVQQKPGFVAEAQALGAMIAGCPPPAYTARLEDALAVTTLCEELTGITLGDTNPPIDH
jgi:predicted dehydrogenase